MRSVGPSGQRPTKRCSIARATELCSSRRYGFCTPLRRAYVAGPSQRFRILFQACSGPSHIYRGTLLYLLGSLKNKLNPLMLRMGSLRPRIDPLRSRTGFPMSGMGPFRSGTGIFRSRMGPLGPVTVTIWSVILRPEFGSVKHENGSCRDGMAHLCQSWVLSDQS